MTFLYDLLFIILALVYVPIYCLRKRFSPALWQRFKKISISQPLHDPIWVHAVSVGEVMAVKPLLYQLKQAYPKSSIVLSTVTPLGNALARQIASSEDTVIYLPVDLSWCVRSAFKMINPRVLIIAETEIWPNLISVAYAHKVPVAIINGRISSASFNGYRLFRFFIKPILKKVSIFLVRGTLDAKRFIAIGVDADRVHVTGNIKFDSLGFSHPQATQNTGGMRAMLSLSQDEKLIVAGSTHPGEEERILTAFDTLLRDYPKARLLIAARHPERSGALMNLVSAHSYNPVRISDVLKKKVALDSRSVFVVDMVGILVDCYAAADVVFVGGSLVNKGGHNILEPALVSKPVIFGQHMDNFSDIATLFLEADAAVAVEDEVGLAAEILKFLKDDALCKQFGARALELIRQHQGATSRNMALLEPFVRS